MSLNLDMPRELERLPALAAELAHLKLSGKQLELLKEIVPKLSRVAVLRSSAEPANARTLRETEFLAGSFKVQFQYLDVLAPKDIRPALHAANKGRAEAVLALSNFVIISSEHRLQTSQ